MVWLIIVSVCWGLSFGLIGNVLAGLPSPFIVLIRLVLSLAVFLPFLRVVDWKYAVRLVLIGAVQFGCMYLTYIKSFRYVKSYEVAIFTIFTPLYVILMYDLWRHRVSVVNLCAGLIAVMGAGVVLYRDELSFSSSMWKGFLIVQVSNVCFALGQLLYARWKMPGKEGGREYHHFAWMYVGGVLASLPMGIPVFSAGWQAMTTQQMWTLLYLGVIPSGLCFFLWNYGARRVVTARFAVMNNLKTPLAALFSIVIFHEQFSWPVLGLGLGLVVIAMLITQKDDV